MISYAQNREDVLLRRVFPDRAEGCYVDVGANEPVRGSVTQHFYESGWSGVNCEPGRIYAELAAARPRDVNLNVAVSDQCGELNFYEFQPFHAFSTCSLTEAEAHRAEHGLQYATRRVPVLTLAEICARHVRRPIDFLSVDVEGHEPEVLRGADFGRYRPVVVLIESIEPFLVGSSHAQAGPRPTHDRWESLLLAADYRFATFDGVNRYYVRAEDAVLVPRLQTPVNVTDDFTPFELAEQRQRTEMFYNELQGWVRKHGDYYEHREATVQQLQTEIAELREDLLAIENILGPLRELDGPERDVVQWARRFCRRSPRLTRLVQRLVKRRAA